MNRIAYSHSDVVVVLSQERDWCSVLLFLNASTQRHEVLTKRSRSSVRKLCSQNVIAKFTLRLMFSPLVCEMC